MSCALCLWKARSIANRLFGASREGLLLRLSLFVFYTRTDRNQGRR